MSEKAAAIVAGERGSIPPHVGRHHGGCYRFGRKRPSVQRSDRAPDPRATHRTLAHAPHPTRLSLRRRRVRLTEHSTNAPHRRCPAWRRLLAQFTGTLTLVLPAAAAISSSSCRVSWKTPVVAASVVVVNAVVGHLQEHRAEQSLDALRSMLVGRSRVRRDAEMQIVDSSTPCGRPGVRGGRRSGYRPTAASSPPATWRRRKPLSPARACRWPSARGADEHRGLPPGRAEFVQATGCAPGRRAAAGHPDRANTTPASAGRARAQPGQARGRHGRGHRAAPWRTGRGQVMLTAVAATATAVSITSATGSPRSSSMATTTATMPAASLARLCPSPSS